MSYSIDEFNDTFHKHNSSEIKIIHFNIVSLNKNHANLECTINSLSCEFNIIILSEIRNINLALFVNMFPNFEFIYDTPQNSVVGGLGIFINRSLNYSHRSDIKIKNSESESVFIELKSKTKNLVVGGIYRHPRSNFDSFTKEYINCCSLVQRENKNIVCLGDFNINLKEKHNRKIFDYDFNLKLNNIFQLIKDETRVTASSKTLIDHIYTNNVDGYHYGVLESNLSDHHGIFLISKNNLNLQCGRPFVRIYSKKALKNFSLALKDLNSKMKISYVNSTTIEENENLWNNFYLNLNAEINCKFPLVRVSRTKAHDKVWISDSIKRCCRKKCLLYQNFKKNPSTYRKEKYLKYKKILHKLIIQAKNNYYKTLIECKNYSKTLFNIAKPKRKQEGEIQLKVDDKLITDGISIAETFNKHFNKICQKSKQKDGNFQQYLERKSYSDFAFEKVSKDFILRTINDLKCTNSCGPDDINTKLIKENALNFSEMLEILINDSLLVKNFPTKLKISKIVPIYKAKDKKDVENYRPIGLLNNINKIFEKCILQQMNYHIDFNKIIRDNQHGFRKHHNCTTALSIVHDSILDKIKNKLHVIGIFLDLSKAFDSIDHEILINKLIHYGFLKEITFFKSYLKDRAHYVQINKERSTTLSIERGVIQGSCLSPLLYSLYCNDLSFLNNKHTQVTLFADDTCILISTDDILKLETIAQLELNNICQWFRNNKLTINPNKSNFLRFKNQSKKHSINLLLENTPLLEKSCTKYLGLFIQSDLKWQSAINEKINKMLKFKHMFKYIRNFVPIKKLIILYKSFITSFIVYGIELYGNCQQFLVDRLQKAQNNLLRIILKKNSRFNVKELHLRTNLLSIANLITFRKAILTFDMLHKNGLNAFYNLTRAKDKHCYFTRSSDVELGKYCHSNEKSIKYSSAVIYNSLPRHLKEINDRTLFKDTLHNYLFNLNFL